ncbi:hypothetical protein F511_34373 [Dorcoceras hygrometricum]|uniref:Uncharacterized protein n=1 Tax=Dorcoceras hygrometricum TaxID=472368 RepID=A0A2Z7BCJ6_9LAMI|nr:hypothetical protein F511_34373 [Dorcoceras hygrometricum]
MASFVVNALQVNFELVLNMEDVGMVRMFHYLEKSVIRGFLGVSGSVFEEALIQFFTNASVIAGTIVSTVANRKMVITMDEEERQAPEDEQRAQEQPAQEAEQPGQEAEHQAPEVEHQAQAEQRANIEAEQDFTQADPQPINISTSTLADFDVVSEFKLMKRVVSSWETSVTHMRDQTYMKYDSKILRQAFYRKMDEVVAVNTSNSALETNLVQKIDESNQNFSSEMTLVKLQLAESVNHLKELSETKRGKVKVVKRDGCCEILGGGRYGQSGPRPETGFLHQPALEGLTRSARTDSPRQDWPETIFRRAAAAARREVEEERGRRL